MKDMGDPNNHADAIVPQLEAARRIYAKLVIDGQRLSDITLSRSDDYAHFLSLGCKLRIAAGKEYFCEILGNFFPTDTETSLTAKPHLLHLWAGLDSWDDAKKAPR